MPLLIIFVMYKNKIDAGFIHAFMAITIMTILLTNMTKNLNEKFLDGIICLHASLLLFFNLKHDSNNYWLMHLILLFLINNFVFPKISRTFSVPKTDLHTVSLVFLNIFLINAFF